MSIARKIIFSYGLFETLPGIILLPSTILADMIIGRILIGNIILLFLNFLHLFFLTAFWCGIKGGYSGLVFLYGIRLIKIISNKIWFNLGYGFNFYFDLNVKALGLAVSINIVSILMLALLHKSHKNKQVNR